MKYSDVIGRVIADVAGKGDSSRMCVGAVSPRKPDALDQYEPGPELVGAAFAKEAGVGEKDLFGRN